MTKRLKLESRDFSWNVAQSLMVLLVKFGDKIRTGSVEQNFWLNLRPYFRQRLKVNKINKVNGSGDFFPTFTLAQAGTRFSKGCKAELTWVVVISQDNLPAKYGHLTYLRNNRALQSGEAEN